MNESKQFEEMALTPGKVKTEPPESPLNNAGNFCNVDFTSESHSSGAVKVKEELEMNYESYNKKSEISRIDSEAKIEIEQIVLKKECMNEIDETWQSEILKPQIKDFENISVELPEEVFIKREILEDPLLEVTGGELPEKREHCESIGESSSKSLQEEPIQEDKEEFDCVECGEILSFKLELDNHMLMHLKGQNHRKKKSHKCDVCGRQFNHNGHLKTHVMIHTGEKPHKCDTCGKSFRQKSALKKHLFIHTGEKPHKCDICGNAFIRKDVLNEHYLTHTGEKRHKCNFCGKLFNRFGNLKLHILTHTGEKSHECKICGKLFTLKWDLKRHSLIHTGEKPHKCNKCEKCFTRMSALKKHLLTHTGEKTNNHDTHG